MIKKLNTTVIARSGELNEQATRQSTHRLLALLTVFALAFIGLTAITGPTQQANAYTSPLCGPADGSAGLVTATTVNYGGKLFDIIGYNKDGNKVGVAGDTVNSVTLLLDKNEATPDFHWNSSENTYAGSTISNAMDTFLGTLGTDAGIIERTLTGGSENYNVGGYNEDYIKGSGVTNQKVWPLSVDEASHLILSTRVAFEGYWLRSPGGGDGNAASVESIGGIFPNGVDFYRYISNLRPALYLDISATIFNGMDFRQGSSLPIGACAPQPNNLGINYVAETVTGLDTDTQGWSLADTYAGLTTPTQTTATPIDISSNISSSASTLYYVKATTNADIYFDSNTDSNGVAQESKSKLIIPARPMAPVISTIHGAGSDITTNMEYNTTGATFAGTWTAIGSTLLDGLPDGTYYVRDKAVNGVSGHFKSFAATVNLVTETTPTLALDYTNETVTGFDTSTSGFKTAGTEAGLTGASCAELSGATYDIASTIINSSKTLWTKKCATDGNHSDSTTTSIVIPARPVAPTISATAPSLYGLGDGYVGSLTTSEEWNAVSATYDGVWTPVTGTSVDNLSAGDKVCVRTIAEVGVKFKSLGSCVTVGQGVAPVSSVSVTPSAVTLTAGQAKQLSVTVLPTYADNKSVVWSSSNNSVATVNSNGKVTAKTAGTVTIKATAQDGSGVVGKSVITVKPKPVSTKAKKAKGSITFIWGSSGFLTTVEIYYRVKGSSKWKIVKVSGADRKKIKLKRKKTYQFQLRGCKTVKGKNYYSAWTKKTVKS